MKKLFYLSCFLVFGFFACQKSDPYFKAETPLEMKAGPSDKIAVCHSLGQGKYNVLQVNPNALSAHLGHGDYIPDADGDGYTAVGACFGSMDDCDDTDASVNPGALEVCGDGKDNNCNGAIDENCGPDFSVFNIRNTGGTNTAPWDANIVLSENAAGDGFSFGTPDGGQKVGYGTKFFDGFRINTIETVNWNLIYGNTGIGPYLNIWVTDGAGNYAIISSENKYTGKDFGSRDEWKIFEYGPSKTNFNWLFDSGTGGRNGAGYLTRNNVRATLSQLSDRIIIRELNTYPSTNVGTGAPRGGYGFNLIWGDTQKNFTQKNGQIGGLSITAGGVVYPVEN